ncbi:neuromedin U receptor homolog nmur-2-like [Clavelina lepadiformis]|uniref:neuromedin U receptor homolog nmur-2-like n=1 Tax=Clavelina lepadiformis TaxID=159417 RepID=UPI0040418BAE
MMAILNATFFLANETSEMATVEPYVRPFNDVGIIVSASIIFTFLVIGLIGNLTTIVVIATTPQLKNIFMHFILSLCVSDLISALISWLFLYRRTWGFDVWAPLPEVFCRFYWASDLMTNYVTALHIFSFALLRYISIQFPIHFKRLKLLHGKIWIAAIWVFTFLIGFIPFFIFFGARFRDRYSDAPDSRWPACTINSEWYETYTLYQKICYSTLLYAPSIGVVLLSILIGATVRSRLSKMGSSTNNEKKKKKERQAVLQLLLIVLSFLIGYIPFTAYEFWSVEPRENTMYNRRADYWFGMIEYFFLRFSECMNPLLYNLGSSKMRHYTKKLIVTKLCCSLGRKTSKVVSRTSATSDVDLSSTSHTVARANNQSTA